MNEKDINEIMEDEVPAAECETAEAEGAEVKEDIKEESSAKEKKCDKKAKAKVAALEKELEEAKKQMEELSDKHLRLMAEYQNFRTRSQKEKDGIYSDAIADCVKELLPLFDNFERASKFTEAEKVAEGLAMILKTVPEVLSKMNIEAFGEVGETFDSALHNAVMHEENDECGEDEITEVFQKGYKIGDKVIRYAMVKVAN